MKIVIVSLHPQDFIGGSEIQCDIIATNLTRLGHQVIYAAINGSRDSYDTIYTVVPIAKINKKNLVSLLNSTQPEIVYWRLERPDLFAAGLCKARGCKYVFAISNIYGSKMFTYSGNHVFSRSLHCLQRIKPNPKQIHRRLLGFLFYLADPIRSFFNFFAFPFFTDAIVSNNKDYLSGIPVKRKVAIPNSVASETQDFYWPRPYVAWVANLKPCKNPEKYYQLAWELRDSNVDFIMVGKIQDPHYNFLATAGEDLSNFHYLGPRSLIEVNGILNKALFLVHTCDPEGFSNNFIQAWLQSKPTVSLCFDPESTIERQGLGYYSKTWPRFVEHVRELICNERIRSEMGQRAKEFANQHFDAETNVRRLESLFASILTQ